MSSVHTTHSFSVAFSIIAQNGNEKTAKKTFLCLVIFISSTNNHAQNEKKKKLK